MAGIATIVVSKDPERAAATIAPHVDYQRQTYEHATSAKSAGERMGQLAEGERVQGLDFPSAAAPTYETLTPDQVVDKIEAWVADMPVTDVMFFDSIAGMPDDLVQEHIRLLGTEVAPRLEGIGKAPLARKLRVR